MGRREQIEAELAVIELEERLLTVKDNPDTPEDEAREVKDQLRAARFKYRTLRDGAPLEVAAGDAVAKPEPVKATANAKKGGKG
jgi:hypothetical protein